MTAFLLTIAIISFYFGALLLRIIIKAKKLRLVPPNAKSGPFISYKFMFKNGKYTAYAKVHRGVLKRLL